MRPIRSATNGDRKQNNGIDEEQQEQQKQECAGSLGQTAKILARAADKEP